MASFNHLRRAFEATRLQAVTSLESSLTLMHRYPRRVSAAVVALLAGSAMTAFGVAPLTSAPLDKSPVVTQVNEAVALPKLDEQLALLSDHALALYRTEVTRQSDTADSLLTRLGMNDPDAARFLRQNPTAQTLLLGRPGKLVKAVTENGRLSELIARGPATEASQHERLFTRLTVTRDPLTGALQARSEQVPLQASSQMASGTIHSSLYAAADAAHIPDAVTNQVAEIFGTDIDFRRELRKGDAFSVVYEGLTADGEAVTWGTVSGRVMAARFINQGKTYDAIWFQEAGRKGAYYDLLGNSKNRAFMASPLAFSRVTSGFARRFHPVLKTWRAHLGTDFGAPTGTSVRTVADGRVSFAGKQNGYGNVVYVQHASGRTTVYAHLSRINVRQGQNVEQGQLVGAVGSTGWATGPHLHFEVRVNGKHIDPMKMARESEVVKLSPTALAQYRQVAMGVAQRLDAASQRQVAGVLGNTRFE